MINFREVVLSYLEEQQPAPPQTSSQQAKPVDNKKKKAQLTQTKQYTLRWYYEKPNDQPVQTLARYLTETFSMSKWPDATNLFGVVEEAYKRKVANILVNFDDYFPLMDFLWYVLQLNNKNYSDIISLDSAVPLNKTMKGMIDTFVNNCKTNNPGKNLNPLFGYVPVSNQGKLLQMPLQKHISSTLIGKLALGRFDNLSIKKALYGILEARKKVRSSSLSNKNIPSAVDYVDKILKNPKQYAGQKQIPPQIRSIYDGVTGELLIEIGQSMHDFFESEYYAAITPTLEPTTTAPPPSEELFMKFISSPTGNEDFSFDDKGTQSVNIQSGKGGYIISNVRTINTPQAKALISELETFANYISEGEPKDLVGKLKSISSTLGNVQSALGIKNM